MASRKNSEVVDLVKESHKAVTEIAAAREQFAAGKIGSDQAAAHIGLFNATARVLNVAIHAERWKRQQDKPDA
jgi:hypothetical protein